MVEMDKSIGHTGTLFDLSIYFLISTCIFEFSILWNSKGKKVQLSQPRHDAQFRTRDAH